MLTPAANPITIQGNYLANGDTNTEATEEEVWAKVKIGRIQERKTHTQMKMPHSDTVRTSFSKKVESVHPTNNDWIAYIVRRRGFFCTVLKVGCTVAQQLRILTSHACLSATSARVCLNFIPIYLPCERPPSEQQAVQLLESFSLPPPPVPNPEEKGKAVLVDEDDEG